MPTALNTEHIHAAATHLTRADANLGASLEVEEHAHPIFPPPSTLQQAEKLGHSVLDSRRPQGGPHPSGPQRNNTPQKIKGIRKKEQRLQEFSLLNLRED